MSEKTQLTRITVPAITDARYIEGMADAFDKINDNFKKIASLPFLQGVQGDSYQLEEYKIWVDKDWTITEDGKILLESIFEMKITKISFDEIRTEIGQLLPPIDGVSPLDFFVSEDRNTIVNNSLYFYVIKDDTGNVIEKQLGQYYYFVDGRLKNIGNVYNGDITGVSLEGFNDYTGFYQYRYNPKSYEQKYLKVEILPSIYYDQNKNDICWKFNGNETGISAIGVKGADGKDADLLIVKVTAKENDCTGVVNAIINPIGGNTSEEQWIEDDSYFKVGKALISIQNENGDPQDFAYGQVIKSGNVFNAYWEPNYNFSKLIGNNRITNYFYNMGEDDTKTSPFYLAIPSSYNRGASGTTTDKKKAHVIKGSSETSDDLNIFYSDNAFGDNGEQNKSVTGSTTITKNLNIQNYNTNITRKLTVSGSSEVSGGLTVKNGGLTVNSGKIVGKSGVEVYDGLTVQDGGLSVYSGDLSIKDNVNISKKLTVDSSAEVSGGLTVNNGGAVISSGGIQVTTEKPTAAPNTGRDANVNSNVLRGHNDPGLGLYNYFPTDITKGGYPLVTMSYDSSGSATKDCTVFGKGDICALKWNGTKYVAGELCLQDIFGYSGKTKIGGSFEVGGTSLLKGSVTMNSTLGVNGAAMIGGTTLLKGGVTMNSSLGVAGAVTASSTLSVGTNLTVSGQSTLTGKVSITGGATSTGTTSGALVVTGGVGIGKNLYVGSTTNIAGITKITNNTGSTGTTTGALVVTGGVGISGAINIGGSANVGNKITGKSGIKVYGATSEFYSGSGATSDTNYLKVDSNGVFVSGGAGKLVLNGTKRQLLIGSLASNNTFNAGIDINNTNDNTSTILFKGANPDNTAFANQMCITTNATIGTNSTNTYTVGRFYMDNNFDKQYIQIFTGYDSSNPIYGNSKSGIQIMHDKNDSTVDRVDIKPKLSVAGPITGSSGITITGEGRITGFAAGNYLSYLGGTGGPGLYITGGSGSLPTAVGGTGGVGGTGAIITGGTSGLRGSNNGGVGILAIGGKGNSGYGPAIRTRGNIQIGDTSGNNLTTLSSTSDCLNISRDIKTAGNLTVKKLISNEVSAYTYKKDQYGISCWSGTNKWDSNSIEVTFECDSDSNENRTLWLSNSSGSCIKSRVWYNVIVKLKNVGTKNKSQKVNVGIKYGGAEQTYNISSHTVVPFKSDDNYEWSMFSCMLMTFNTLLVIPITVNDINVHVKD